MLTTFLWVLSGYLAISVVTALITGRILRNASQESTKLVPIRVELNAATPADRLNNPSKGQGISAA